MGLCAINTLGHYLGTGYGAEATIWYAERFNDTGNPIYFVGGVFAALWTPETYIQTALTLAAAPYVAAEIAAAGAQSAIAAARVAAKEVVKEVIGVPVPARPKFSSGVRHGPINPGPLADDIANTFRSGAYTAHTLDKPTTLYRVISDTGNPAGSFWTRVEPKGPLQSVIDSAIDQNWGNAATRVVKATIPAGTKIYEGAAAAPNED